MTPLPFPSLSTSVALLPSLLLLETVLSADNALALASMLKRVASEQERNHLLNWGMATALALRLVAVAAAGFVLQLPLARILGGAYLVWLGVNHFRGELSRQDPASLADSDREGGPARQTSSIAMVFLLAGTNLAFSLDSICAALALTDSLAMVMAAGIAGVVVLRALASWLVRWMEEFPNLANAGYLTVLAVGLRLLVEQVMPALAPPDPLMLGVMAVVLGWGFLQPQPAKP